MTIDLLLEALEMLKSRGDNPDYKQKLIEDGIGDLKQMRNDTPEYLKDIWHGSVYVIGVGSALDLMNIHVYDEYNRMMHDNGKVDFKDFWIRCRASYGLEEVPLSMIRDGFEYIRDLWHDNVDDGYNEEILFANKLAKYIDWHNKILESDESLDKFARYNYKLSFAGKEIDLPFHADTWDAVDMLLKAAKDV